MVPMSKDDRFKRLHNELYVVVEMMQEVVKRIIIIKEELHTLDGSQTRLDDAGTE